MSTLEAGPVTEFCSELRRRVRASGRDLPGVAREIRISRTQLYAILNGEIKRPPDYEALVRPLVLACGATETELADWRRRHEVLVGVHAETRRRAEPPAPDVPPAPVTLPAAVAGFTGRDAALSSLDAAEAPVVVVTGMAGSGKTALVVHWAHRAGFGDGKLYADLRGFDPDGEPAGPEETIRTLLDGLGAAPGEIPPGTARMAALFRERVAGRRLLVVLDNARDAAQVRPLLAGAGTVRTVVTSRNRLSELVAEVGAEPLPLDPPGHDEALALLRRRAGRPTGDQAALEAIVTACGRLPLALALVAARLRQTGFAASAVLAELRRPAPPVLDGLRAVFSWSAGTLTPGAARLFRLLGSAGAGPVGEAAVSALAGRPAAETARLLRELTGAALLDEPAPGRYAMHDLLRAYARTLTPDDERRAALTRLLDHYTHTAYQAELALNPSRAPIPMPLSETIEGVDRKAPLDLDAARQWLATERAVLLAALRQARDEGLDRYAWQLGWALDTFLGEQNRFTDEGEAWAVALRAATALVDRPAVAHAHRFVAVAEGRLARFADAHDHMRQALEVSRDAGDRAGEAETLFTLSYVCWLEGDHDRALDHVEASRQLWAEVGHAAWTGKAGNAVGWYRGQLGDHERAVDCYRQALSDVRRAGDRPNEIVIRDNLGQSLHALGRLTEAEEELTAALRLTRDPADPTMAAWVTVHLGDLAETAGDLAAAESRWREAWHGLRETGHPYAADIARRLPDPEVR